MRRFRRFELIDEPFFLRETPKTLVFPSFIEEEEDLHVDFALALFNPCPLSIPFEFYDVVSSDLVRVERTPSFTYKRVHRVNRLLGSEFYLQSLSDRVAELESRFDRLVGSSDSKARTGDRKYTWTAEIKDPEKDGFDRKYKWVAEIVEEEKKKMKKEEEKKKKSGGVAKNFKWTAEIKGKGEDSGSSRKYTFQVESGGDSGKKVKESEKEKENKCQKDKKGSGLRIVEIEGPSDEGAVVLRKAFATRLALQRNKGKRKDISPQDAALLIQASFRAYLIRRSKALRALRELAVAKSKLKEIRSQFNNFTYRRRVSRDAEERQRFTEKIIVLLLTVDAIEGADLMVRSVKRSMVDELEAMLDVVDPQPTGRSVSIKRRTFDMPDAVIRKEIEQGVAQVVQMLDEAENSSTFEACL